jgi:DNA-binding NarL/FixJ family response regulator
VSTFEVDEHLKDRCFLLMMGLVAGGLSNKEIARQLDMTEGTIKLHLNSIFRKMRVKNRTTLATLALRFQQWQN